MEHKELQRLIAKLRDHIDNSDIDSKSRGLMRNILEELKPLEKSVHVEKVKVANELHQIISLWKKDPVIRAYMKERKSLEEQILKLSKCDQEIEIEFRAIDYDLEPK